MKDAWPTEQERLDIQYHAMRIIADNLYNLRKKHGLSQLALANIAGVWDFQISKLEWNTPHRSNTKGYYNVTFQTLCLIASAFDISVADLCTEGFGSRFVVAE